MVLVDAVPAGNNKFKEKINAGVYRSFVDKTSMIKIMNIAGQLGLIRLFQLVPYNLPTDLRQAVVEHLSSPYLAGTVLNENENLGKSISEFKKIRNNFPDVPLQVICRTPEISVEWMTNKGISYEEAVKVENLWQDLSKDYLKLSTKSKWILAEKSGHSIHLDRPEIVIDAIKELIR